MAVVAERGVDEPAFLPQLESAEWFLAHGPGNGWENRFTLTMTTDPPFDPQVCARHVSPAALLMVVATEDRVAPTATAVEAFARATEPKALEMVEGHHFVDYQGAVHDHVAEVMTDFLLTHL